MQNNTTEKAVRIQVYTNKYLQQLVNGYRKQKGLKESTAVCDIMKSFFDKMSPQERNELLARSKHSY